MTNENIDNYYERQPVIRWSEALGRKYEDWKMPVDTEAEDVVLQILRHTNPGEEFRKFSDPFAPLDFGVFRDSNLVAVGEIKRRNTPRDHYYTVPLNLRKIDGFATYERKGIDGYYFVLWSDQLGYISVERAKQATIGTIGTKRVVKSKTDINDAAYMIPQEWFIHVCQSPHLSQS